MNQMKKAGAIELDVNDKLYIADHDNKRVTMWTQNTTAGTLVINANGVEHPEGITFDKYGYFYLTGHDKNQVRRYTPDFSSYKTVAGSDIGSPSLNNPLGMDLDDDFNLYIAERDGKKVTKWAQNATVGTTVITSSKKLYGIVLARNSSDQAYISSTEAGFVYLWTFGASVPNATLYQVSSSADLSEPRGIQYDKYGALYVSDKKRVVMYCANSIVGKVAVSDNNINEAWDVAFDSNVNMYVLDSGGNKVLKYTRL